VSKYVGGEPIKTDGKEILVLMGSETVESEVDREEEPIT
jgi:hypothetical protein